MREVLSKGARILGRKVPLVKQAYYGVSDFLAQRHLARLRAFTDSNPYQDQAELKQNFKRLLEKCRRGRPRLQFELDLRATYGRLYSRTDYLCFTCLKDDHSDRIRRLAHYKLMHWYMHRKAFRRAVEEADAFLAIAERGARLRGDVLNTKARAHFRLGAIEEARSALSEMLTEKPDEKKPLVQLSLLFPDEEDHAQELLTQSGASQADSTPQGILLYAKSLFEKGMYNDAEALCTLGMENHPAKQRLFRALIANIRIKRDGTPESLLEYLAALNVDAALDAPNFDGIKLRPTLPNHADLGLVSVVVTVYNAAHQVRHTVRSILAQDYSNIELILVNDCSTDESAAVLEELASNSNRIRVHTMPRNGGTYMAKNAGIALARGDYIALCDSDDIWTPNHVLRHLETMRAKPRVVVSTSLWVRIGDDCMVDIGRHGGIIETCPHSTFFRKEVFSQLGYFDSVRFGADRELLNRIELEYGRAGVVTLPECLTLGRRHPQSLTTSGAGALDSLQRSNPRLEYWETWNNHHVAMVESGGRLYNSGNVGERPYQVPASMEPFPTNR